MTGPDIAVEIDWGGFDTRAVLQSDYPVRKEVVLLGGGHAHVAVLKSFGMRPMPGVRLTMISKDAFTAYSGMLPGFIAGHYQLDEMRINLRALCHFAGAQFYQAQAVGLDLESRRVLLADRPPVRFDLLSINIGSTASARAVPGAREHAIAIRPMERFLVEWEKLIERIRSVASPTRLAVVGGGAGGVEFCLSARHRLTRELQSAGKSPDLLSCHLFTDADAILPTHNPGVRTRLTRLLRERAIQIHPNSRVTAVRAGQLVRENGPVFDADMIFWVTNASAPPWLRDSGLRTDADGFVVVNAALQSVSHPFVLAAGDIAAVVDHPRPKSGVFAVRQGKPLADNLRRALEGMPPRSFRPQRAFLSLISAGDRYAVASRSGWSCEGAWVWQVKDWIDRRWMRKYRELPSMGNGQPLASRAATELSDPHHVLPRCGGCGAKVGSAVLTRVLRRLQPLARGDVVLGLGTPDDAAAFWPPQGMANVQTVDFFRCFLPDPYLFGRIAANHALGDIHAMGAEPQSALAVAVAPFGAEDLVEEQLFQMLSGAVETLNAERTALAGGHTAEGKELALGLVVNGCADPTRLFRKGGLRPGDRLILTKALGTGTLFAADMRRQADPRWIESALASMLRSNRPASLCFQRHGVTGCTDITGFGLVGHSLEMIQPSRVQVVLRLSDVPWLPGAIECVRAGIFSSLQPQNLRQKSAITNLEAVSRLEPFPLLFDPQTAGGLLAGVEAARADACLAELRAAGYDQAAIIGEVEPAGPANETAVRIV